MVHKKLRILIAEDSEVMARALSRLLHSRFDVVGICRNGKEALQSVQDLQPDVVVLDILMPIMDGIKVARSLGTLNTTAKTIMLTGLEDPKIVNAAFAAGADGYVFKRRLTNDLLTAIDAVWAGEVFVSPNGSR